MENETEKRIKDLENLMVEHRHNGIDSTSALPPYRNIVQYETSAATITPVPGISALDITAIATAFTIANPRFDGVNFQKFMIRIKDNGTARAITWGSLYVAGGFTLPTTTVAGKYTTLGFQYCTANGLNKWQLIGMAQEA